MHYFKAVNGVLRSSIATSRPAYRVSGSPTAITRRAFAYPKEGLFQQDSPARPQYGAPLPPPPPPSSGRSRWGPWFTTSAIAFSFFGLGIYQLHEIMSTFISSPPTPEEDASDLAEMMAEFDSLPVVQSLRSSWRLVDGKKVPVWKEWTAYQALKSPSERAGRLTTGPLAGSYGVGAQRVFLNEADDMMVAFVCFGNGVCGWPGIVHGGVISTILDEAFARFAMRHVEGRAVVTANLELNYVQKSEPGEWYVVIMGNNEDHAHQASETKKYMTGVMACCGSETPRFSGTGFEDVHPHVVAKALYVVPKNVKLAQIPDEF